MSPVVLRRRAIQSRGDFASITLSATNDGAAGSDIVRLAKPLVNAGARRRRVVGPRCHEIQAGPDSQAWIFSVRRRHSIKSPEAGAQGGKRPNHVAERLREQ